MSIGSGPCGSAILDGATQRPQKRSSLMHSRSSEKALGLLHQLVRRRRMDVGKCLPIAIGLAAPQDAENPDARLG
jgi:hypothetical protein